jgi:hypothetical protein
MFLEQVRLRKPCFDFYFLSITKQPSNTEVSSDRGGLAMLFLRMRGFFLKIAWHFKDIFREFAAFLKIWIIFEDIFRVTEALFN